MADYINENILCQAYVHVESSDFTEESLEELRAHLQEFVKPRAEFFLYPNADIDIQLKEGSIKVYATILGTVASLYTGVANYPEFREGASVMYEDVKRLSDYIATESIFSTRAKHNQIIRVEARTGVIGSIKKIVNQLDAITSPGSSVQADTLAKKIRNSEEDVQKLLGNLESDDDTKLIKGGILEMLNKIPETPPEPNRKSNTREAINSYKQALLDIKASIK